MKRVVFAIAMFLGGTEIQAQDPNVLVGLNSPANGVKIKTNWPGLNGGWARSFQLVNQNDTEKFISFGALGDINNGVSSFVYGYIGKNYDDTFMTFKPNGHVGIGTTNPSSIFHIASSAPVVKIQNKNEEGTSDSFYGWIGGYDKNGAEMWWLGEGSTSSKQLGLFTNRVGYDLKVLNSEGKEVGPGKMGDIVVKLPLPPGTFPTLWDADKRYKENYMTTYPGYYQTYDAGHIDEDGYVWIMSRTDDIINVAGHRLSTGAIEEVLAEHKDVAECAVLGIADKLKGQIPIGLLALKAGVTKDKKEIISECIKMVRDKVGPVAAFKIAVIVKRLPKTRSGKILRGTVRKIADKEPYKMPATIDDPAILDEIKEDLIKNNILK